MQQTLARSDSGGETQEMAEATASTQTSHK